MEPTIYFTVYVGFRGSVLGTVYGWSRDCNRSVYGSYRNCIGIVYRLNCMGCLGILAPAQENQMELTMEEEMEMRLYRG